MKYTVNNPWGSPSPSTPFLLKKCANDKDGSFWPVGSYIWWSTPPNLDSTLAKMGWKLIKTWKEPHLKCKRSK